MLERRHELAAAPAPRSLRSRDRRRAVAQNPRRIPHASANRRRSRCLLPVLLATARQNVGLFTGPLFRLVDEVVLTPGRKSGINRTRRNAVAGAAAVFGTSFAKRRCRSVHPRDDARLTGPAADRNRIRGGDGGRSVVAFGRRRQTSTGSIQAAVRQMWELIESLVEFSRIGRKAIKLKLVDLDELVRAVPGRDAVGNRGAEGDGGDQGRVGAGGGGPGFAEDRDSQPDLERHQVCQARASRRGWRSGPSGTATGCLMFRDNGIGLTPGRSAADLRAVRAAARSGGLSRAWDWAFRRRSAWSRSSEGRSASLPRRATEARFGLNLWPEEPNESFGHR